MTIYNIGPGQTYETFTALVAAQTLTAGDIVDGGGDTFSEMWVPDGSGSDGNRLVLRNATINANGNTHALKLNNRGYIEAHSLTLIGGTSTAVEVIDTVGTNPDIYLHDIIIQNAVYGMLIRRADDVILNNISISNSTQYGAIIGNYPTDKGANYVVSNITIDGTTTNDGILIAQLDGIQLSNITVNNSKQDGIELNNLTGVWSLNEATVTNALGNGILIYQCSGAFSVSNLSIVDSALGGVTVTSCVGTSAEISVGEIEASIGAGLAVIDSSGITLSDINSSYSGQAGIRIGGTSSEITIINCIAEYGVSDGFSFNETVEDIGINSCVARYNGNLDANISSGDGFTAHGSPTGLQFNRCNAYRNQNTGWAMVEESATVMRNCICVNNGTPSKPSTRGGIYLTDTATMDMQYCVVAGNFPFNINTTPSAGEGLTTDYNCIDDSYPMTLTNGVTSLTFAQYQATGRETNGISVYPLFIDEDNDNYSIYGNSPIVDAGIGTLFISPASSTTLDALGNTLQYLGPVKKSLKQVGPDLYEWQPDPQLMAVIGVDNACFGADGTAVQFATPDLALAALASLADDEYLFGGLNGAALYSEGKSAKAALIKKYLADVD